MNNSGDAHRRSLRKTVSLSRTLVFTQETSISSLLILGKLHSLSDGAPDMASLSAKLIQAWAPSGTVNFLPVTDGAFLLLFNQEADLRKVMDGAPWSCDGDHLFLVRQVMPEVNLVDQLVGVGFTTADLWVQFHHVPVEYLSAVSLYALATSIGEPVAFPDLGTAPADLLRARIRVDITRPLILSLTVNLEDGRRQLVSVVYEQLPSLCRSCGIIGHPPDRCPLEKQPEASHTAASPLNGDITLANVPSYLLSIPSSSAQVQPVHVNQGEVQPVQSSVRAPPQPSKPDCSSASTEHPVVHTQNKHVRSANGRLLWNKVRNFFFPGKKKGLVNAPLQAARGGASGGHGHTNLQDVWVRNTVLPTISAQDSVQDSMVMLTEEEINADRSRDGITTLSSFQLDRGCVNYFSYLSRSLRKRNIELNIETQSPQEIMIRAMEWLQNYTVAGLNATYDGQRLVISIVGLQIDQRMAPVDIVTYLRRPKDGGAKAQKKPDSPARFNNTITRLHNQNCGTGAF